MGLLALGSSLALSLSAGDAIAGQLPVSLGKAGSFAALAGSTVTSTGLTTLNGDLGVSPGSSLTGFPPGKVNGTIHATDPTAAQAQADLTAAYNDAAGRTPPIALPADVGGKTLTPGVYKTGATPALGLTGALTLDGQGDPNAVFVFQVGSALTTAVGSRVNLIGGAQACNVFWQIGSSATLGTSSTFAGSILALSSVSMNDGVTVNGRALARNGAVTLINDTITVPHCAKPGGGAIAGQPGYYFYDTHQVGSGTSGTNADVNVITGNLLVSEQDLTSDPSTSAVAFSRYYNSFSGGSGELGAGWSLSVGPDVSLTVGASSAQLVGPNGYAISFEKRSDGSFAAPLSYEGSLTTNADGTFTLDQPSQSDTLTFDSHGKLSQVTDGAGNTFTVQDAPVAGKTVLSSYGPASGKRLTVSHDGSARIIRIDDPAGNHRTYAYNAQNQLISYQGPSRSETYGYDANGHLNSIVRSDGSSASAILLPNGQVSSLTVHSSDGSPDQTTAYSYGSGSTTVTYPDASQHTYYHDSQGQLQEDSSVDQTAVGYYSAAENISPSQAESALQLQDRAAPLDSRLVTELGDQYVGMWFDLPSGRIKVGIGPTASQQTVSQDLQQAGISSSADIVSYKASYADLTQGQSSLEAQLSDLITEGSVRLGIAADHDAVQIEEDNDMTAAQQAEVQKARSSASVPTSILASNEQSLIASATSCAASLCDRPLRGGQHIDTPVPKQRGRFEVCTAGFMARSNVNNLPYVLTAGHCMVDPPTGLGSTWYSAIPKDYKNGVFPFAARKIGQSHSGYFGGTGRIANGRPPNGDAGLLSIDTNSFWNYDLQPIVVVYAETSFKTTSNIHYPILSSGYTPSTKNLRRQHFVVCTGGGPVIGQTPEPTERCGQVKAVNVDPHYGSGPDPKALGEF